MQLSNEIMIVDDIYAVCLVFTSAGLMTILVSIFNIPLIILRRTRQIVFSTLPPWLYFYHFRMKDERNKKNQD